jgi:hypothetical protein
LHFPTVIEMIDYHRNRRASSGNVRHRARSIVDSPVCG